MQSVTSAGRTAAGAAYDAAEAAMAGERGAEEAYCAAVQEAAETANLALMVLADNADPTSEIVSYLLSMAQAETDAEIGRMAALGTYQIAVKQEYLDGLSPDDPRRLIALEDLLWTETTAAARNIYYERLGAATMQYYSSVYSAMNEYNTTSRQLQYSLQTAQRQKANVYTTVERQNAWDLADRNLQREKTLELSLLDAVFSKWVNETNFEAEQAGTMLADYQAGLEAIDGVDDAAAAAGMYDSLSFALSGWQAAGASALNAFCAEQQVLFNGAEAAAKAVAGATESADAAWYATAMSEARAAYEADFYDDYAAYLLTDGAAYADYVSVIDAAQQELAEEQCRLLGLLMDAVNTGVNNIAEGTTSIDVQVCFRAGTPVQMADETIKPVEEILPGDLVPMVDQNDPTGKIKIGRVVRVFHNDPQPLWILRFGGLELGVTKEHPFFVYGKGWVAADDLEIGDVCRSAADTEIVLTEKTFDSNPVPVYNFEVEDGHTYFVGGTKEESVLVHNTCYECYYEQGQNPPCYAGPDLPCYRHSGPYEEDYGGWLWEQGKYACTCYCHYLSWSPDVQSADGFDVFCSYAKPIAGGTAFVAGTAAGGLVVGGMLGITELGAATSIRTAGYVIWNEATVVSTTGTIFPATFIGGGGTGTGAVMVSRWGRPGLQSGDWVMPGGTTRTNYILSGKWQPGCGNQYAHISTGQTFSVPAHTVCVPNFRGFVDNPIFKAPFNQKIYDPTALPPIWGAFDVPTIMIIAPTVPIEDMELIITTPND